MSFVSLALGSAIGLSASLVGYRPLAYPVIRVGNRAAGYRAGA